MTLEINKHEKKKPEYPVLKKAFRSSPEEFRMLQAAYTPGELSEQEERLKNTSWDPNFLPKLLAGAKERLVARGNAHPGSVG